MIGFKREVRRTFQEDIEDLNSCRFLHESGRGPVDSYYLYNAIIKAVRKRGYNVENANIFYNDKEFMISFNCNDLSKEHEYKKLIFSILKEIGVNVSSYNMEHGRDSDGFVFYLDNEETIELYASYSLRGYEDPVIVFSYNDMKIPDYF